MVEKEHAMIEKGHVIIKINMGHLNIIMMSFLHLDVYDMFINKETRYVYTENTFWVKKNTLYLKKSHKTFNVDHFTFDCTLSLHRERV